MQYWLRMSGEELAVAQVLIGGELLPGALELPPDYEPTQELVEAMVGKGFLVADAETGTLSWSDFAYTVLWCALHAEATLKVKAASAGHLALLSFCDADMVLLSAGEGDEYTLYYLPTLERAVGGLAHELAWLDEALVADDGSKVGVVELEGRGRSSFSASLVRTGAGAAELRDFPGEGDRLVVTDHIELVKVLNPWIIESHRQALL